MQPKSQKGYFLIAHTAYSHSKGSKARGSINPISLKSTKARFILGASLSIPSYELTPSSTTISGLPSTLESIPPAHPRETADGCELVVPDEFPPGSVLLYETQLVGVDPGLEEECAKGAAEAFAELDLVDLNVVLHRCEGEERDATSEHKFHVGFIWRHAHEAGVQTAKSEHTIFRGLGIWCIVVWRAGCIR